MPAHDALSRTHRTLAGGLDRRTLNVVLVARTRKRHATFGSIVEQRAFSQQGTSLRVCASETRTGSPTHVLHDYVEEGHVTPRPRRVTV